MVYLAPKIQETILLLPRTNTYRAYMSAKDLLKLVEIVGLGSRKKCSMRFENELFEA
jgi:hypothetical protein